MTTIRLNRVAACAVALLTACAVTLADGATIKGKVKWGDEKPYRGKRMKNMNKECTEFNQGEPPRIETVVTNDNQTVKNVLMFVQNPPKGDYQPPAESAHLDQQGCVYVPHVLSIMVGQTLEIKNSDPTAHNIHFLPERNKEFNKSQPKKDLIEKMTFQRPEVLVPVKCDVHPWMNAFIGVFDHPFHDVTGDEGTFEISGLPGGSYTIEAKHEKYGSKTMEVTVATDETKEIEFTFARADGKDSD